MMWTVIVKNSSGSDYDIEDLGVLIIDGTTINLSNEFTYTELCNSDVLRTLVGAGSLVINDGVSDLSAAEGVNYLTLENLQKLGSDFYTKTELQSAGNSEVHWENISHAPSFGSPVWSDPVEYRVLSISSTAPSSPAENDVYIDTNTDHYMQWDGSAWQDKGAVVVDDKVINLTDNDIYTFDGTNYNSSSPADNTAVLVNDDGDGKNAQYIYSTEDTIWYKIGDVDFAQHFNGGPSKHDSSEIDVEGSYSMIPSTPTDLETTVSEINDKLTSLDTNVNAISLDYAYDGDAGSGAGKTVATDSGPVTLDAHTGSNAPLELTNLSSFPSTALASGQLAVVNGLLYIYDNIRGKWLSVQRQTLTFGRRGLTKNMYINLNVGTLPSINSGFRLMRNAVITGLSFQIDHAGTGVASIRSNNITTNLTSISLSAATGNQDVSINLDLSQGDFLQAYVSSAAGVEDPILVVELAWTV